MMKLKFQVALAAFFLLPVFPVRADEIGGLVLMPDGKPAENAKIIARFIGYKSTDRTLSGEEVTTETDLLGFFDATVPQISYIAGPGRQMRPYLLVDAPGCAVSFIMLGEVQKRKDEPRAVIRLKKDTPFQGTVLGPQGKAVSGAEIKIVYWSWGFESSPLNSKPNISTSQLTAQSGADGKFSLRGIHVPGSDPSWGSSGSISVAATINGSSWTTTHPLSTRTDTEGAPAAKPLIVTLGPTVTFSGHIRDALTGRGMSGVLVSTVSRSPNLTTSTRTGYDGSFKVTALSETDAQLRFTQNGMNLSFWREASDKSRHRVETTVYKSEKLKGPLWIKNLEFRLPPVTTIRGQLIDEATGEKPLVQDDVIATIETTTQNGWKVGRYTPLDYSRSGEFSFAVPIGSVTLASGVREEFSHAYSGARQKFEVPAKGLQNVRLRVQRNPGFFVRLRPRDKNFDLPYGRYTVHLEGADGTLAIKEMNDEVGGYYWFAHAKNWGDKAKLRILRDNTPITAWRPVIASKEKWPLVLTPGQ